MYPSLFLFYSMCVLFAMNPRKKKIEECNVFCSNEHFELKRLELDSKWNSRIPSLLPDFDSSFNSFQNTSIGTHKK